LLTAAEVNDFDKWEMWGSLAADEFHEWSDFWTMTPTKRYTVQLQNNEFGALAIVPFISLIRSLKRKFGAPSLIIPARPNYGETSTANKIKNGV